MRLLLNVSDRGNFWEVISINQNEIIYNDNSDFVFEIYNWGTFERISSSLMNNKSIYFSKNIDSKDLTIDNLIIFDNNLNINFNDKLVKVISFNDNYYKVLDIYSNIDLNSNELYCNINDLSNYDYIVKSLLSNKYVYIPKNKIDYDRNEIIVTKFDKLPIYCKRVNIGFEIINIDQNIFINSTDNIIVYELNDIELYDYINTNFKLGNKIYIEVDQLNNINKENILISNEINNITDGNYYPEHLGFYVTDKNDKWLVVSVNNSNEDTNNNYTLYKIHSFSLYTKIVECLNAEKIVYIPKNLTNNIDVSDLIIFDENADELELKKNIYIRRMNDTVFTTRFTKLSMFDYHYYTYLNNYFIDKGFIITEDNREEKYLEIINYASELDDNETDNNEQNIIIEKLEKYLAILDKISIMNRTFETYTDFIEQINDAETEEDLDLIFANFNNTFS